MQVGRGACRWVSGSLSTGKVHAAGQGRRRLRDDSRGGILENDRGAYAPLCTTAKVRASSGAAYPSKLGSAEDFTPSHGSIRTRCLAGSLLRPNFHNLQFWKKVHLYRLFQNTCTKIKKPAQCRQTLTGLPLWYESRSHRPLYRYWLIESTD